MASQSAKKTIAEIDGLKAETYAFFEALASDVTASYTSLDSRLGALEAALAAPSSPPRSMDAPQSALELACNLRKGNPVAFNFDALLAEVERDQELVVEDQRRTRAAQEQLRSTANATPPSAGSGVPIQAHGTTQHPGVSMRARGGDLDASDTSFSATPVRRTHKAVPSAPASPSHPSHSQHQTPSRPTGYAASHSDPMGAASAGGSPSDGHRRPLAVGYDDNHRPYPAAAAGGGSGAGSAPHLSPSQVEVPRNINQMQPTSVLVEFKRQRVLQYDSDFYVAPGEHVVVGGDRGEDIGLVTYSWTSAGPGSAPPTPFKSREQGTGKVLRVATTMEVGQLQGVQAELEKRAKEVAQLKVQEHQLPMAIVDAEYQFDRKKLTFFYQSQHRLDFRVLVRDLYKTFRARIWMELV
eukprot:CAMPEP_0174850816 /NCGR_PEP_ID=MMETSP1114-20130205/21151_1 /TAXON_ID=312471 /ORGANISM="Neobodo designis, Strain CCAP 1951/1" /LENGTH=410 /DNA_ID=CAMNT_0016085303 /DNA_START=194 /DNA_END=1426 /DNA_ORIENTATION=+